MESSQPEEVTQDGNTPAQSINWTASEYISHEKTTKWHTYLFAVAGVVVFVVYIISKDILASIVILLSATAMSVYAKKPPSERSYELGHDGVSIDGKAYGYDMFKSFSIVEEGAINSIWLKPIQRISPTIVMYFPQDKEEEIQDMLAYYLPFEEKSLDAIDRLTKRIRF